MYWKGSLWTYLHIWGQLIMRSISKCMQHYGFLDDKPLSDATPILFHSKEEVRNAAYNKPIHGVDYLESGPEPESSGLKSWVNLLQTVPFWWISSWCTHGK